MKYKNLSLKLLLSGIFSLTLGFTSCKKESKPIPNQTEITFTKEGELTLYRTPDSIIKTLDIEIADNAYERETGLMHRYSMKEKQGMLFVFETSQPRYFYMKNTHIPLDLIYIDENKKVVSFQLNAKPMNESSLPSNAKAQYVLEINAGLVDAWGIKAGDSISY